MEQLDESISSQILITNKLALNWLKLYQEKYHHGNLIGTKYEVPALDFRIYTVKFKYGHFEQYSVNILAESLSSNIDDDGYDVGHIKEICGYRTDTSIAISRENRYYVSSNGNNIPKVTIKKLGLMVGWTSYVRCPN